MDNLDATGKLFSDDLQREIKRHFHLVDEDFTGKRRVFLDNAGGGIPDPNHNSARLGNEAVAGLRTVVTFR
ncbi:hypothetical protein AB3X91_25240 [Paraburkholderia sp. BR14263]|uniref:hypothetical protein n=1 Tax=unclassified Paraburkholderia TaxID=2615204 RepID=UPI0034CDD948